MRQKHKANFVEGILAVIFALLLSKPAFAYIDPGTVSIVVQALVAGMVGVAATFRYWINWVKGLFTSSKRSDESDEGHRK